MHAVISTDVSLPAATVLAIVSDLTTYREWLDLVSAVEGAEADEGDTGPAWFVTITAKVGPFARSKKLRMVRTSLTDTTATFDRHEVDGREHSNWQMRSEVATAADGSSLTMDLRYDGSLFSGPLEKILHSAADDAGTRLEAYATSGASGSSH